MPIMSRFRFSAKLLFLIMTLVMSYYALEVLKGTDTDCPRFFRIPCCVFFKTSFIKQSLQNFTLLLLQGEATLFLKNKPSLGAFSGTSATSRVHCRRDAIKPTQSTGVQKQSRALWKRHRFFTNPKSIICQFALLALGLGISLRKMMHSQKIHSVNFK